MIRTCHFINLVYIPCEAGFCGLSKISERQNKSVFPNPASILLVPRVVQSIFLVPRVVRSVSEFSSQDKKYMFPQTT